MSNQEDPLNLSSLQNDLALIDLLSRSRSGGRSGLLEQLILKKGSIKIKMYKESKHQMPHFHIDYGSQNHAASYAIESCDRIEGKLDSKYDKSIKEWATSNKTHLVNIWKALQTSQSENSFIQQLSALD